MVKTCTTYGCGKRHGRNGVKFYARKLIQDASLRKAEEKAEAKRKKQLTKGPHGNDTDNKKEDLQQRVIRAISFNNITSSTTPSDNSALVSNECLLFRRR